MAAETDCAVPRGCHGPRHRRLPTKANNGETTTSSPRQSLLHSAKTPRLDWARLACCCGIIRPLFLSRTSNITHHSALLSTIHKSAKESHPAKYKNTATSLDLTREISGGELIRRRMFMHMTGPQDGRLAWRLNVFQNRSALDFGPPSVSLLSSLRHMVLTEGLHRMSAYRGA